MARTPKKVETIHPLAIAASIEAQSNAVLKLVLAIKTMLSVARDAIPPAVREMMEREVEECSKAMWPGED